MKKYIYGIFIVIATTSIFYSCSKSADTAAGSGYTYSTTSNVGDYAEWTYSGTTISVKWSKISSTGAVSGVMNVSASCGSEDATYAYRTCTVSSASCSSGSCGTLPTNGSTFNMLEVPGVALFVHTGSGSTAQLHTGFLLDSNGCNVNVSGDYTYMHVGVGKEEIFGLYRTDSTFNSVTHAEFGFLNTTSSTTNPTIKYTTAGGTGNGIESLGGSTCSSGVRTRTLSTNTIRSMMTASGLFILDLPSGQGGLVSFKTTNAATLADLANKNLKGITFPDNGSPQTVAITSGAVSGSSVSFTGTMSGGSLGVTSANITALSNTTNTATAPAYPNFTSIGSGTYSNNSLSSTYANPSTIPGLFRVEGSFADTGRLVIAFMKVNGKILGFGAVYNYRTAGTIPTTGITYSTNGMYNSGNFILFEK